MSKQEEAIKLAKEGHNLFITGGAGRGKSFVINKLAKDMDGIVISSPTGAAALKVGGMTCHKMFGLPLGLVTDEDRIKISKPVLKLFRSSAVKTIILEEISMLRTDHFEFIDQQLKMVRNNKLPFGGIQIIGVGDFHQLESVVSGYESKEFYKNHKSNFCFTSPLWNFKSVVLDKCWRVENLSQVKKLDSIGRKDKWHKLAVAKIMMEAKKYNPEEDILHLCCYKEDVNRINFERYKLISGREQVYNAEFTGNWKENDRPIEAELRLKEGCKVIICSNHREGEYVNGEMGIVLRMGVNFVVVRKQDGVTVNIGVNTWERYKYSTTGGVVSKEVEDTYSQIPLKLAYAQTIHKVQGATLPAAVIDFGKGCFSHGQAYVALSRVQDLTELRFIRSMSHKDVVCKQEVLDFYESLEE